MKTIEVISIPVTDQEVSKAFYIKLGFQVMIEAPMGNGQSWVQLGLPGQSTSISLVSFWPNEAVQMQPGSLHGIIFETADIENDVNDLKEKNIEVGKIDTTPWGKFSHIADPDGNILSLHQQ